MIAERVVAARRARGRLRAAASVVIALAALGLASGAAAGEFEEAMGAFKAGRFHEAAAAFQALVDRTPGYDFGLFMLGHCYLKTDQAASAEPLFRRALEIRGERVDYLHGLAVALTAQRKYQPALDLLLRADPLVVDARSGFSVNSLAGHCLASMGRWEEAEFHFERAVGFRIDRDMLVSLGKVRLNLGKHDRAAAALQEALKLDPDDPEALLTLAESWIRKAAGMQDPARRREAYASALAAAQRLASRRPGDPRVIDALGRAALGAGRQDLAETAFRQALVLRPGSCATMINLSRVSVSRREWDEAERRLREAERCAPQSPTLYLAFGYVLFQKGRFQEALDAYRRAEALEPSPAARAGIAAAQVRADGDEATVPFPPAREGESPSR